MAMMSSMGGASGALFGTFFRAGGKATGDAETFGGAEAAAFFKAGSEGVMSRGNAEPGAKTMVDALDPAAKAAADCGEKPIAEALATVAVPSLLIICA
jgi:dihydroxyacetone kinase-like protein